MRLYAAMLIIAAVVLGYRAFYWKKLTRTAYLIVATLLTASGILLVHAATNILELLLPTLIGYVVTKGHLQKQFDTLEGERARERLNMALRQNRWYNVALGLFLWSFALIKATTMFGP